MLIRQLRVRVRPGEITWILGKNPQCFLGSYVSGATSFLMKYVPGEFRIASFHRACLCVAASFFYSKKRWWLMDLWCHFTGKLFWRKNFFLISTYYIPLMSEFKCLTKSYTGMEVAVKTFLIHILGMYVYCLKRFQNTYNCKEVHSSIHTEMCHLESLKYVKDYVTLTKTTFAI